MISRVDATVLPPYTLVYLSGRSESCGACLWREGEDFKVRLRVVVENEFFQSPEARGSGARSKFS